MPNYRLTRKKSINKTRFITLIVTSLITIISLFINFFGSPKLEEYKSKTNTLQAELQSLQKENSTLTSNKKKLNQEYSSIQTKINSIPNSSK